MAKITNQKADFIKSYIAKLQDALLLDIDECEEGSEVFDIIYEICTIFEKDIPDLEGVATFRHETKQRDSEVIIGILNKYLIDNGYNEIDNVETPISRFWKSFKTYFENELSHEEFIKEKYIEYTSSFGNDYYLTIDYKYQFHLHYGLDYDEEMFSNISHVKLFIELAFQEWIKVEKRYAFTKIVNDLLKKFNLPYKLQKGKIVNLGYKTTYYDNKIINYAMLERKIQYAEEMILSGETLDKKCALDYIIDSLQYLISIQEGTKVKDKYISSAIKIAGSNENKIYKVIYDELDELMKISNEYFDIRHNEYLNKSKEEREPITDPFFIEYLYNRAFALLYNLKLKCPNYANKT